MTYVITSTGRRHAFSVFVQKPDAGMLGRIPRPGHPPLLRLRHGEAGAGQCSVRHEPWFWSSRRLRRDPARYRRRPQGDLRQGLGIEGGRDTHRRRPHHCEALLFR